MSAIQKVKFDGFDAVEVTAGRTRLVLVYEIGPRIAFLSYGGGENLLYWDKNGMEREGWKLYGGHRVWLTRPEADESEDTYLPDNAPCSLLLEEGKVTATAPAHPVNRLARAIEVQVLGDDHLLVTNRVANTGPLIYSGGVWSPTCVNPAGKTLRVPLGAKDAAWDLVKIVIPRIFAGNVTTLEDDQARFCKNDLVVTPKGRTLKRVCCAPQGKVLLECGGFVFEKYAPYNRFYPYPMGGCNVAVFVGQDNFMAEMETYGPEGAIHPGESIENTEHWRLYETGAGA